MLIVNALIEKQHRIGKVSHRKCVPGLFVCVCVCMLQGERGKGRKKGGKKREMNVEEWILETASSPIFVIYVGILALFYGYYECQIEINVAE